MGKNEDKRGASGGSSGSRDDLKIEHARLVAEETRLGAKCEEVKGLFQKLEEAYATSKGTFSVSRYGQLKDMIKTIASDDVIREIRNTHQSSQSSTGDSGKTGMRGLLKSAQEFSSGSQQQQQASQPEPASKPSGKSGKMSGFMKKIKNITGFSDEPIEDEDVMSNTELERDNARRTRCINRHKTLLEKAVTKLEKLQRSYQASKSHAPPKRYQELKDMIKECVAEKLV